MAITYTRTIQTLPAYKEIDGNTDVVFSVNWALVGVDGNFSASWPITTQVPYVAGDPFIPYADLTEVEVNAWIDQYTLQETIDSAKSIIQKSIETQQTVTTPPLPWAPPSPEVFPDPPSAGA